MKSTARLALIICILFPSLPASSQSPSSEDIVRALEPPAPRPGFRSLRGLTVESPTTEAPPSIDLQILFEYDSDRLTNEGLLTLQRLGDALRDERLAAFRFRIAGHTDAKGSAEYNQLLSERRAASVREHLVKRYSLAEGRIESAGYGKSQLADPSRPEHGINRRVQIINIGQVRVGQ